MAKKKHKRKTKKWTKSQDARQLAARKHTAKLISAGKKFKIVEV